MRQKIAIDITELWITNLIALVFYTWSMKHHVVYNFDMADIFFLKHHLAKQNVMIMTLSI